MQETPFSIRRADASDAAAITAAFNRVFSRVGPEFVDRSPDWWHWKYAGNPCGFHSLVAEDAQGAVVAHYGGVPVQVQVDGQCFRFGQNCDTFSDPAVRRGLRNPGLFVRLAQAYASTHAVPNEDAVMYGLPSEEAARIGARYLDYWMLRNQPLLVAPSGVLSRREIASDLAVHVEDRVPDDIDPLADRMATEPGLRIRRDLAFLRWRFERCPDVDYRFLTVRERGGRLRAVAVHRPAVLVGSERGTVVDLAAPDSDIEAIEAALVAAAGHSVELGLAETAFLTSPRSPSFEHLQSSGFRVFSTPYSMTARPYDSRIEPAFLRERWMYTLADFDIV